MEIGTYLANEEVGIVFNKNPRADARGYKPIRNESKEAWLWLHDLKRPG